MTFHPQPQYGSFRVESRTRRFFWRHGVALFKKVSIHSIYTYLNNSVASREDMGCARIVGNALVSDFFS